MKTLLQNCGFSVRELLRGTHLTPKFGGEFRVFKKFVYSSLDDSQFWHGEIISIYTTTFLQIAHHLDLNLRFLFEFGELNKYETLLDYQESDN
jgi:hypothetical protein